MRPLLPEVLFNAEAQRPQRNAELCHDGVVVERAGKSKLDDHERWSVPPSFRASILTAFPAYLPSAFPILKRNRFDGSVAVVNRPERGRDAVAARSSRAEHDFIRAVVGWADLADPRVGDVLDEYQRHAKFRGVCYWFEGEPPQGLAEVTRRGLTLDVSAGFTPAIAEAFPALRIAIDHVGTRRGPLPPPRRSTATCLPKSAV